MTYNPSSGGSPAWASITGKPSTFPPDTPQTISHITNLQTTLDGKQPLATVLTNTTTQSYPALVVGTFIAGASPAGTIKLQMASETAGTNVTVKTGSFLKYRAI